jgi:hypothetical protein
MVQEGYATSLIIYPNFPKPKDLALLAKAQVRAKRNRKGAWKSATPYLNASEFRWIIDTIGGKRDGPDRYCGDFATGDLYPPQSFYLVPDERRVWFYEKDLSAALIMGFRLQV